MTEALQKVTREIKAVSADKYDVTAQGEKECHKSLSVIIC